jgi:hypothetical protein
MSESIKYCRVWMHKCRRMYVQVCATLAWKPKREEDSVPGFYINWLLEKEKSTIKRKKRKNVRSVCERMSVCVC